MKNRNDKISLKILTNPYTKSENLFVFLLDYSNMNFNKTKKIVKLFTF